MADGKLLEGDKDEWFYQSMNKYTNLYMFELEFPLDTLEVINETSLCVSGLQEYSKRCELLQLCVPPKLLQKSDDEEGLCKDRDFKILSGGYASGRIRQVKFVKSSTNLVAAYQDGYSGIVMYEVGDDNRATILEKCRLSTKDESVAKGKSLCYMNNKILLGTTTSESLATGKGEGITLTEWKIENSCSVAPLTHVIWKVNNDFNPGHSTKIREWDANTCMLLTSRGTLAMYDLRTGLNEPGLFFHATKSPNIIQTEAVEASSTEIIFTFDCISQRNQIGVFDSCGGYETFDARFVNKKKENDSSSRTGSRSLLQEFTDLGGVYSNNFNIEYEERTKVRENERNRFIISGLKKECVPVLEENYFENTADADKPSIQSVFSHDGHSKPVTHATWHPAATNLIFSASLDAVLHAWQFIPEREN